MRRVFKIIFMSKTTLRKGEGDIREEKNRCVKIKLTSTIGYRFLIDLSLAYLSFTLRVIKSNLNSF